MSVEPGRMGRAPELAAIVDGCPWFGGVLGAVREAALPDAWVGAGVLRDLVWGARFGGGFDPAAVRDVDVAFFDAGDLSGDRDRQATAELGLRHPDVPWEATNQASVHLWYPGHFGEDPVEPLHSTADGVATWPETATAVAVRLGAGSGSGSGLEICAPYGLDDLLGGVWRRNPQRVSVAQSRARLARHDPRRRWPGVEVVEP